MFDLVQGNVLLLGDAGAFVLHDFVVEQSLCPSSAAVLQNLMTRLLIENRNDVIFRRSACFSSIVSQSLVSAD